MFDAEFFFNRWLGLIKDSKLLKVETTANQDPLAAKGIVPLLGIDVWEHAYYLQKERKKKSFKISWISVTTKTTAALHEDDHVLDPRIL
jgi:Fe-Mn family superoxide dismutase